MTAHRYRVGPDLMEVWEDDEPDMTDEEIEEREQDRALEIASRCTCGAVGFDEQTGHLLIVADCCCGAY